MVDLVTSIWDDLHLPTELKVKIVSEFQCPTMFQYAFDTPRELSDLLHSFLKAVVHEDALRALVKEVIEWQDRQRHRIESLALNRLHRVKKPRILPEVDVIDSQQVYLSLAKVSVSLQAKISRTNHRKLLQSPDATKTELEKSLRDYWAKILVGIVQDANLPVVDVAQRTMNPVDTIVRAMGNRRAKTLRSRARAWLKFRDWLAMVKGIRYPGDISDILDYLWCCTEDGCAKSVVQMFSASLSVIEDIGMVPVADRYSNQSVWLKTCKHYLAEFEESQSTPKRTAPPLTIAMLVSMELHVVDEDKPTYERALLWAILVAVWADRKSVV